MKEPDIRTAPRIGDDDRRRVTDRLREFFATGYLDQEELDVRLDRALRAVTGDDLEGLLGDLPEQDVQVVREAGREARSPAGRQMARRMAEENRMAGQMDRERRMARRRTVGTVVNVAAYPVALTAIVSSLIFFAILTVNNTWGPVLCTAGMVLLAVNIIWSGVRGGSWSW